MFSRERSRGTGPRATGPEGVLLAMRRSGSGDPELQFPAIIVLIVEIVIILLQNPAHIFNLTKTREK